MHIPPIELIKSGHSRDNISYKKEVKHKYCHLKCMVKKLRERITLTFYIIGYDQSPELMQ